MSNVDALNSKTDAQTLADLCEGKRVLDSADTFLCNHYGPYSCMSSAAYNAIDVLRAKIRDVDDHIEAIKRRTPKPPSFYARLKEWM